MHPEIGGSTMGVIVGLLKGEEGLMKMLPARKCLIFNHIKPRMSEGRRKKEKKLTATKKKHRTLY